VLHNLVKNALEAWPTGRAARCWCAPPLIANDERPLAEIQVLDNGGGFDEANLGQIFEALRHHQDTRYRPRPGDRQEDRRGARRVSSGPRTVPKAEAA